MVFAHVHFFIVCFFLVSLTEYVNEIIDCIVLAVICSMIVMYNTVKKKQMSSKKG